MGDATQSTAGTQRSKRMCIQAIRRHGQATSPTHVLSGWCKCNQHVRTTAGWPTANVAGKMIVAKTNLSPHSQVIKKATVYLSTFLSFQNVQQHAETLSNYD
jgi:hypothetical protein